jgi:hypothetical protein
MPPAALSKLKQPQVIMMDDQEKQRFGEKQ